MTRSSRAAASRGPSSRGRRERLVQGLRQAVGTGDGDVVAVRLEDEGGATAQCVAGRLGERVERLAERERRAKYLRDPVEAALHLHLAFVGLEALGVVERERSGRANVSRSRDRSSRSAPLRAAAEDASPSHVIGASTTSEKAA